MPEAASVTGITRVRAAAASDRGRIRDGNEDRVYVDVDRGIFAVIDGVGGHAAGEVAAAIAVDIIAQRLSRELWSPAQRVREAIALANNEILTQAGQSPQHAGMTCVLTVALLTERGLTVGHVGDTRLYKIDAMGLQKLTHDPSPGGGGTVSRVDVEGARSARAAAAAPVPPDDRIAPAAASRLRMFLPARGTWLVAGLLAGLALGLAIAWTIAMDEPVTIGPRTLQV